MMSFVVALFCGLAWGWSPMKPSEDDARCNVAMMKLFDDHEAHWNQFVTQGAKGITADMDPNIDFCLGATCSKGRQSFLKMFKPYEEKVSEFRTIFRNKRCTSDGSFTFSWFDYAKTTDGCTGIFSGDIVGIVSPKTGKMTRWFSIGTYGFDDFNKRCMAEGAAPTKTEL